MLLKLSLSHLWREKHYPEFKIMALALFLAVFAVSTLLILTQTIRQSIIGDASTLLGADLVLESPTPIPPTYEQTAQSLGLATSKVIDFLSMVSAADKSVLAAISAIEGTFPLRGTVSVNQANQTKTQHEPPSSLHVWLADTLAFKLNSTKGDNLSIGDASFVNDGTLIQRPVALSDSSVLAPVAYVNASDLAKMAVIQPGSRVTYRLLIAGKPDSIAEFKKISKHDDSITWVSAQEGRPGINRIVSSAARYLVVILLIQMLLGGVAIALCVNQYRLRQQHNIAIWKSFGAHNNLILNLQLISLTLLALVVMGFAISAGYGASFLILQKSQLAYAILEMNWEGGVLGALSGLLIFLGFGIGPLWELKHVSPLQLLQNQERPAAKIGWVFAVVAVCLLGILFSAYLQESEVALRLALQVAILSGIAFAIAYFLWGGFQRLSTIGPLTWRFGVAYMVRHKSLSIMQWFVFTLVITLLLLLQIIQRDFVGGWKEELPRETPNTFLINIQQGDIPALSQWFEMHHKKAIFYPMVRGRMSHINGQSIEEINQKSQDKKGLQRSLNLTWMRDLPADNQFLAGIPWGDVKDGQALISIEKRFSDKQGLQLGDTLSFQIAQMQITAKIAQIRSVQWESFKPNFFVIFPPKVLDDFPHSYITSVYLPFDEKQALISMIRNYAEISMIDIDGLLQDARAVVDKITSALQGLLILVFSLGVLIMFASILSCLKERLHESAMLQVLGANRRLVAKVLLIEFGVLGLLSGVVGSFMAYVIASDLARQYFDFSLKINVSMFGISVLSSMIAVLVFGLLGTRKVFQVSPLWLLRQTN